MGLPIGVAVAVGVDIFLSSSIGIFSGVHLSLIQQNNSASPIALIRDINVPIATATTYASEPVSNFRFKVC